MDHHGLPPFVIGTPSRASWKYSPAAKDPELKKVAEQIKILQEEQSFRGSDMVGAFISRRVSPLQRRAHKICHMGGRMDATRTSTHELSDEEIFCRIKAIAKLPNTMEEWSWGKEPYSRTSPAPVVSFFFLLLMSSFLTLVIDASSFRINRSSTDKR